MSRSLQHTQGMTQMCADVRYDKQPIHFDRAVDHAVAGAHPPVGRDFAYPAPRSSFHEGSKPVFGLTGHSALEVI